MILHWIGCLTLILAIAACGSDARFAVDEVISNHDVQLASNDLVPDSGVIAKAGAGAADFACVGTSGLLRCKSGNYCELKIGGAVEPELASGSCPPGSVPAGNAACVNAYSRCVPTACTDCGCIGGPHCSQDAEGNLTVTIPTPGQM
jgi:hypothetical protein